jgi:hypothetical protein
LVKFIQSGYSSQVAPVSQLQSVMGQPAFPITPFYTSNAATMQTSSIETSVPDPIANGTYFRWTTHWTFVMQINYDVTASSAGGGPLVEFPEDPRTGQTLQNKLQVLSKYGAIVTPS